MSFKFGSEYLPTTQTVELTSGIGRPSYDTLMAALLNMGYSFQTLYEMSAHVGSTVQSLSDVTGNCTFHGGRTGLHDSCELIVTEPEPYNMSAVYPGARSNMTLVHYEGETATQLDGGVGIIVSSENRDSNSVTTIYGLIAVPYQFINETLEPRRRKGYVIFFTTFQTVVNRSTGKVTVTYMAGQRFRVDIPYWNVNRNLDMYWDEPEPEPEDEPPFEPSDPEPYNPDIDDTSDTISIPGNPLIGVSSSGFIHVYNPSINSLQSLGTILCPNPGSASDVVTAILVLCETLANQNLVNFVLDCHVVPVSPQTSGNANIFVGYRDTNISVPVVSNDYIDATCGSLSLSEYFSSFADYLYTRSKLYLPFIGFVDMLPEYWQAGVISVDYKFNVIDGSFMCYVKSTSSKSQLNDSIIAQYAGNACMHFPITGVNYASMVSGIIGAGIAAASAGTASAVLGQAYSAANTYAQGGDVQQSNGYNSTAALMGVRTPYLLIERPVPSYSSKYAHEKGYPSNIATALENVTGFTIVDDIDLSGLPFTEVEINELRTLLKEGVYF